MQMTLEILTGIAIWLTAAILLGFWLGPILKSEEDYNHRAGETYRKVKMKQESDEAARSKLAS